MQIKPKEIGQEAMIAGAVDLQTALEFLVAILAFATLGIVAVGGARNHQSARTIGDDETAIGPLVSCLLPVCETCSLSNPPDAKPPEAIQPND
jgi:hypothetical protein